MPIRIRYRSHDLELPQGEFVIGRSPDCHLALDDENVSRRHAEISVRPEGASVRDLGSRNGVVVNGVVVTGSHELNDGDCLAIGSQLLRVSVIEGEPPSARDEPITVVAPEPKSAAAPIPTPGSPQIAEGLADKLIAAGRPAEAERLLRRSLIEVLAAAHRGESIGPERLAVAASAALRLAIATGRGSWVDYVIELHLAAGALLPVAVVNALYEVLRKLRIDVPLLNAYIRRLRADAAAFGPAELFQLQRIEGLQRIARR